MKEVISLNRRVDELPDTGYAVFDSAGVVCLDLKLKTDDGLYEDRDAIMQLALRAQKKLDKDSELRTDDFMEMFTVVCQGQFYKNQFKLGGITFRKDQLIFEFLKRKSATRFELVLDKAMVALTGTMGRLHVRRRPYNSDVFTVEWRNGKVLRICKDIYFNPA